MRRLLVCATILTAVVGQPACSSADLRPTPEEFIKAAPADCRGLRLHVGTIDVGKLGAVVSADDDGHAGRDFDYTKPDLRGANLRNFDLDRACLKDAALDGADLRGADLSNADLTGAKLGRANLLGARYNATTRWPAGFDLGQEANARGMIFNHQKLTVWPADLVIPDLSGKSLDGLDLHGAWLKGAEVIKASLREVNLTDANLDDADLSGADLRGARLVKARLRAADLLHADLRGAVLAKAELQYADLGYADLRGTDLTEASLDGAVLIDAAYDGSTRWPKDFVPLSAADSLSQLPPDQLKPLRSTSAIFRGTVVDTDAPEQARRFYGQGRDIGVAVDGSWAYTAVLKVDTVYKGVVNNQVTLKGWAGAPCASAGRQGDQITVFADGHRDTFSNQAFETCGWVFAREGALYFQVPLAAFRSQLGILDRAIAASPQDVAPLIDEARFLEGWGDYYRALDIYARARFLLPNDADALFGEGRMFFATGDFVNARASLERAATLRPSDSDIHRYLDQAKLHADDGPNQPVPATRH